jgi:hypothetical protein
MHKKYRKIHDVSNMKLLIKQRLINQRRSHLTMQMRKYTAMIIYTVSTDTGIGIDPIFDFQFSVIISPFGYKWNVIRTCPNDIF